MYKIYGNDISILQSVFNAYGKYFGLLHRKDRYTYIDSLIEILCSNSEEIEVPMFYQYLIELILTLEYTRVEKRYILLKLENFRDAHQIVVLEKLKKGKKERNLVYLALIVARIEIALNMIQDDPLIVENKENESMSKRRCKAKFKVVKTKLTNYLETLDELEKAIEKGKLNKKLCDALRKVCKAISKEKELVDRPIIEERSEQEDNSAKPCKKKEDHIDSHKKRKTHYA